MATPERAASSPARQHLAGIPLPRWLPVTPAQIALVFLAVVMRNNLWADRGMAFSRAAFQGFYVLVSGLVIGGGAHWLHKFAKAFGDWAETMSAQSKALSAAAARKARDEASGSEGS